MARNWFKDGQIDTAQLDQIEAMLLAVTNNTGKLMDIVSGKGMVPAFQCGHSGLLLPGDYVKEWGRLYGIGLGPHPVSEVLDTDYSIPPAPITPDIRRIEQIMHPVGVCFAQVDLMLVTPEELVTKAAITDLEDRGMHERIKIIHEKQMVNPKSQLRVHLSGWKGVR